MKHEREFHTVRGYQLLESKKNSLTSAMEDYLEMIYRNTLKEGYVRINTLAELLNVRASSATKMVQNLAHLKLINYERYGIITLTETGKEMGDFLLIRHNIIESFLKKLGNINVLLETELIEHNISEATMQKIDLLNKFLEANPEIMKKFEQYKEQYNKNQQ